MMSRVLLLWLVTVFGLSFGQDGDHTNHLSQIISGVGEKLKTAGYQEHELTEKVLNIKPNDTTFYHSTLCSHCFKVYDLDDSNDTVTVNGFHESPDRHSHPVRIPFPFTYFGQQKENITITTEGFLSLRDLNVASMSMMKVQQISALRADFAVKNGSSDIRHLLTPNGEEFVVEWKDVVLQQSDNQEPFHFQIVLSKNGTVTLNYIRVPDSFQQIANRNASSKDSNSLDIAGMSDALHILEPTHDVLIHHVMINLEYVHSGVSVRYTPYSPCHKSRSCGHCTEQETCVWCPHIRQCFDGQDSSMMSSCSGRSMNTTQHCTDDLLQDVNARTDHYKVQFHTSASSFLNDHDEKPMLVLTEPLELGFLMPYFGGVVDKINVSQTSVRLMNAFGETFIGPVNRMEIVPPLRHDSHRHDVTYQKQTSKREVTLHWRRRKHLDDAVLDHVTVVLNSLGTIQFVVHKWEDGSSHLPKEIGLFDVVEYVERYVNVTDIVPFIRSNAVIQFKLDLRCQQHNEGCVPCQKYSMMCQWDYLNKTCDKRQKFLNNSSAGDFLCSKPNYIDLGPISNFIQMHNNMTKSAIPSHDELYKEETFYKAKLMYQNTSLLWSQAEATHNLQLGPSYQTTPIKLDFGFPFFGYSVREVSVALDGYIILPSHLTPTLPLHNQMIAPFKRFHRTQQSNETGVYYGTSGGRAVFEWRHVTRTRGSFKAVLYANGTIVFLYQGLAMSDFRSARHRDFVVGVRDGYLAHQTININRGEAARIEPVRSHDYHILNMIGKVLAGPTAPTAIQFTSLPTCNLYQSCLECTTQIPGCVWCDSARKCTRKDGRDREWQKLEDALCYRPSHQVERDSQCKLKLHVSKHRFYKHIWQYNPDKRARFIQQPPPISAVMLDIKSDVELPGDLGKIILPFTFTFYDMQFEEVGVSTEGFLTFLPQSDLVTTSIDVFRRFEKELELGRARNIEQSSLKAYFVPGRVARVIIRWGNRFEASLQSNGVIAWNYFNVTVDEARNNLHAVGLKFRSIDYARSSREGGLSYTYSVDWVTESVRNGLSMRFEPLPTCTDIYGANCTSCLGAGADENNGCIWCHESRRCQEIHLPCRYKHVKTTKFHCRLADKFHAMAASRRPSTHAWVSVLLVGVMGALAALLTVLIYGYHRPTSYPGRMVVRMRMTKYRLLSELRGKTTQLSDSQMHINDADHQ